MSWHFRQSGFVGENPAYHSVRDKIFNIVATKHFADLKRTPIQFGLFDLRSVTAAIHVIGRPTIAQQRSNVTWSARHSLHCAGRDDEPVGRGAAVKRGGPTADVGPAVRPVRMGDAHRRRWGGRTSHRGSAEVGFARNARCESPRVDR